MIGSGERVSGWVRSNQQMRLKYCAAIQYVSYNERLFYQKLVQIQNPFEFQLCGFIKAPVGDMNANGRILTTSTVCHL